MKHHSSFVDHKTGNLVVVWHTEIASVEEVKHYDQHRDKVLNRSLLITTKQGKEFKCAADDLDGITSLVFAVEQAREGAVGAPTSNAPTEG